MTSKPKCEKCQGEHATEKCTASTDRYGFTTINHLEILGEKGDRYYAYADDMIVTVYINGIPTQALVHSGSPVTCISDKFFNRMKNTIAPGNYLKHYMIQVQGANETRIKSHGLVKEANVKIEDFEDKKPEFNLTEYFLGRTNAWGIFEDRFGNLKRQFKVNIVGYMDDNILILENLYFILF